MSQQQASRLTPVASAAEAEQVITRLNAVMDDLLSVVVEETELLRGGKLNDATKLSNRKAELARLYIEDAERLKEGKSTFAQAMPETLEMLRRRHEDFRARLQVNLTVLATAHAVSESIIRGVSSELARKAAPTTYGATGRANVPSARASQPLAVSRSL
jgi:flagellar biosynthesis/type III secretory pathway chaperone